MQMDECYAKSLFRGNFKVWNLLQAFKKNEIVKLEPTLNLFHDKERLQKFYA